jgi:hypothetical protein
MASRSLLLHGGESPLLSVSCEDGGRESADIRNGTGGLAKSGKTAVDYGVINLKYGVYHIDTAQVSYVLTYADELVMLTSRGMGLRRRLEKLLTLLESSGILSGLPPRVRSLVCNSLDWNLTISLTPH